MTDEDEFKNVFKIVDLLQTLPATSVACETSFSQLKLIKTSRRMNLNGSTLDALLVVKLTSPAPNDFQPDDAINKWLVSIVRPRKPRIASSSTMNYCRTIVLS